MLDRRRGARRVKHRIDPVLLVLREARQHGQLLGNLTLPMPSAALVGKAATRDPEQPGARVIASAVVARSCRKQLQEDRRDQIGDIVGIAAPSDRESEHGIDVARIERVKHIRGRDASQQLRVSETIRHQLVFRRTAKTVTTEFSLVRSARTEKQRQARPSSKAAAFDRLAHSHPPPQSPTQVSRCERQPTRISPTGGRACSPAARRRVASGRLDLDAIRSLLASSSSAEEASGWAPATRLRGPRRTGVWRRRPLLVCRPSGHEAAAAAPVGHGLRASADRRPGLPLTWPPVRESGGARSFREAEAAESSAVDAA